MLMVSRAEQRRFLLNIQSVSIEKLQVVQEALLELSNKNQLDKDDKDFLEAVDLELNRRGRK